VVKIIYLVLVFTLNVVTLNSIASRCRCRCRCPDLYRAYFSFKWVCGSKPGPLL